MGEGDNFLGQSTGLADICAFLSERMLQNVGVDGLLLKMCKLG